MAELLLVNPRKRKKARKSPARKSVARRAVSAVRSSVAKVSRRYRRNPIASRGAASNAMDQFKSGAIGAAGALAVDVAMQKLPIPANLKTGTAAPIVKGLVGIGIGMLVAKVGKNRDLGKKLAQGAVTVSLYAAGKEMLKGPLGLSGYDNDLGADFDDLGYYGLDGADDELGAYEELSAYDLGDGLLGDGLLGAYDSGAVQYN